MVTNIETQKNPELINAQHLGKCWAALRGDNVISVISMRVPNDVAFEAFREKAIAALELLGQVKAGDLYKNAGAEYFLPRPNKHQNRSKKKPASVIKPLKLFDVADAKSSAEG